MLAPITYITLYSNCTSTKPKLLPPEPPPAPGGPCPARLHTRPWGSSLRSGLWSQKAKHLESSEREAAQLPGQSGHQRSVSRAKPADGKARAEAFRESGKPARRHHPVADTADVHSLLQWGLTALEILELETI